MRQPDIDVDGWELDDAEECQRAAPRTFGIPEREAREGLRPGDLAKLIFRISVDDTEEPVAVERMWVIVRERVQDGYLGILDNDPEAIDPNEEFWSGVELPFAPRHVISIEKRDEKTVALAAQMPTRRWLQT